MNSYGCDVDSNTGALVIASVTVNFYTNERVDINGCYSAPLIISMLAATLEVY